MNVVAFVVLLFKISLLWPSSDSVNLTQTPVPASVVRKKVERIGNSELHEMAMCVLSIL